jgi:hypothetical protein
MARHIEHSDTEDMSVSDVLWVSPEDGRRMFDEAARKYAGISGEEFIRRYDGGEYSTVPDDEEHRMIIELGMLVDIGR